MLFGLRAKGKRANFFQTWFYRVITIVIIGANFFNKVNCLVASLSGVVSGKSYGHRE